MTIDSNTTEVKFNVVGRTLPRVDDAAYSTLEVVAIGTNSNERTSQEVVLTVSGCWLDVYVADFGTELLDIDTYQCTVFATIDEERVQLHEFSFNVEQDNTQTDENLDEYGIFRQS